MKNAHLLQKLASICAFFFVYSITLAQETQIPFCENVQVIDSKLGRNISILKSYSDFKQATLSQSQEGYVVSVIYKKDGIFQTDRKEISISDLEQICQEIADQSTKASYIDDDMSQEARRRLIASSTTFSIGYYGWAIPMAFGADDNSKAYIASYLLVGGGGFSIETVQFDDTDDVDIDAI